MNDVALLCIGTELLDGSTRDLNLKFLGKYLDENNLKLKKAIFCSDSLDEISPHLDFDGLLIISGGLGPTQDDITKNVLSSHFNQSLEISEQALEIASKQFSEKNKTYDPNKYDYHHIPHNFDALYNEVGYAPGLKSSKYSILALPGVPREFQKMITTHFPKILSSEQFSKKIVFRTRGIIEVNIFNTLDPDLWNNLSTFGEVSSLPQNYGVDIGVRISANNIEELEILISEAQKTIEASKLSEYVWSTGETIEQKIHEYLVSLNQTVSTAESCTGGLIANLLTNQAGSSQYFMGTAVTYQNHIKTSELNISSDLIEKHGVVSREVSEQMAIKCREKFHTDYSIATTGHLEYIEENAPHVWISIASKNGVISKPFHFYKDRITVKKLFAKASLHLLRNVLFKQKGKELGNTY